LTENTSQIAVGEKYGAGTVPAYQGFRFALAGICRIDDQFGGCSAKPSFTRQSIYTALSGTQTAFLEDSVSLLSQ